MINFVFVQNLIHKAYAASPSKPGTITNPVIDPKLGSINEYAGRTGVEIIGTLLGSVLSAMFIIGVIILIIMIIWSGIAMMTSGNDKEKVQTAQKRLTYAIVGFVILISVFAIANFVGGFFGLGFFKTLKFPFPTP